MDQSVNPTGLTREQAERMHFYYLPVSPEIREMCWNQGTWKFYLYYAKWEKRAYDKALEIINIYSKVPGGQIDVLHKLNMICYREPGQLWKIKNIPFVWGPVGGCGLYPLAYLNNEGIRAKVKTMVKNLLIWLTFRAIPKVRMAMKRADVIISAYKENLEETTRAYRSDSVQINETGAFINSASKPHASDNDEFKLMWVGKYDHRKQLGIAIKTMEILKDKKNIHLYVLGGGYDADVAKYKQIVEDLHLSDTVHLMGVVPNVKTREMMQTADLLFFTSVDDATSTVVPEAIGAGLPVICHATMGFGDLIDEKVGRKVVVKTPQDSAIEFASIISKLEANREVVREMSANCIKKQYEISWEANAKKMVEQYEVVIDRFNKKKK